MGVENQIFTNNQRSFFINFLSKNDICLPLSLLKKCLVCGVCAPFREYEGK